MKQKEIVRKVKSKVAYKLKRIICKLRMWYAEVRGHKGKRWDYEPSEHYFGRRKHNDKNR